MFFFVGNVVLVLREMKLLQNFQKNILDWGCHYRDGVRNLGMREKKDDLELGIEYVSILCKQKWA